MSALARISDSSRTSRHSRFVPKAVVSRCSKNPLSKASLFDHLVGDCQELRWKYQAGGQIDRPPEQTALRFYQRHFRNDAAPWRTIVAAARRLTLGRRAPLGFGAAGLRQL